MRITSRGRRLRLVALLAGLAALAVAAFPAHAAVSDATGAALSNAQDMAAALLSSTQANVTCRTDVYGGAITQHTNLIVGDVFGHDFAIGHGVCNSLTLDHFSGTLFVNIEWYDAHYHVWREVSGSRKQGPTKSSSEGVLELTPLLTNVLYSSLPSPYLDRYHRGHAWIVTSFSRTYPNYTPATWYMKP